MPKDYIESILKENRVFYPSKKFSKQAHIRVVAPFDNGP